MGRTIAGTLSTILASTWRDGDYTIDIVFPSYTYRFATSPITVGGFGYTNDLEKVSQIRQTIEAPADLVSVGLQNRDRVLGLHVAANWQLWRQANAIVGRNYYQMTSPNARTGVSQWLELFRGAVQQPNANDAQVTFQIISDILAPGDIISDRNLGPICPAVFGDSKTCGYIGLLSDCNHMLRSAGGCEGRNNTNHFMGFEHRQNPDANVPGTAGNDDPSTGSGSGTGGGYTCPRLDQFTLVKGPDGERLVKMVGFVTEQDEIWNPKLQQFFPIERVTVIKRQPIWEVITAFGGIGYSSSSHPIISNAGDDIGKPVSKLVAGSPVLGIDDGICAQTKAILVGRTKERGDVLRIEMKAERPEEKIYCYGDIGSKMIACHNSKPIDPIEY